MTGLPRVEDGLGGVGWQGKGISGMTTPRDLMNNLELR